MTIIVSSGVDLRSLSNCRRRPQLLLLGVAIGAALAGGSSASAQSAVTSASCAGVGCGWNVRGKALDNSAVGNIAVGENTEHESAADEGSIPFQISVDGEVVDESGRRGPPALGTAQSAKPVDRQRKTDVDLSAVDIQVKFDGLDQTTLLNVSTTPIRRTYQTGETVRFLATSNYPAFIDRAEIRIRNSSRVNPVEPVFVLPVSVNGEASWVMPESTVSDFDYVLRVYDAQGRYDETQPLTIARSSQAFDAAAKTVAVAPGMAGDRTALRNIPVYGGAVTVFGRNVPVGYSIEAFGETIPLDPEQSFVVQRILPPGDHAVDVALKGASKSGGLAFSRDINIPKNDWFYVAIADLTIGKRFADSGIEAVRDGDYDSVYTKGRLAFYLKGKIKGRYLLTASGDTREDKIGNLFKGLDSKDAEQVLNRIDPEDYYPVYGDDSTASQDAPTDGKFYVRLERGDSHVMWGNFRTAVTDPTFIGSSRSLYGASAVYRSEEVTSYGERRSEASVYAAQGGTLPQKDQFLATGGSAYFLKRQDVAIDSETVTVEIRDKLTGNLLQTTTLVAGDDYTVNYSQGLVMLAHALSSSTMTTEAVRKSALGGLDVYLVVQYEYTPLVSDTDSYAYGGRAQHWLGEHVRIGVTGMTDTTGDSDYEAMGADLRLQLSKKSFLEAEIARSKGFGFTSTTSTDGGLSSSAGDQIGTLDEAVGAWRLKGTIDLEDIGVKRIKGSVSGYYEDRPKGFSTESQQTTDDRKSWGLRGQFDITDKIGISIGHDQLRVGDGQLRDDTNAGVSWALSEKLKLTAGAARTAIVSPSAILAGKSGYDGSRMDGGLRADYRIDDDRSVYAFAQATVQQNGDIARNDRAGVGGKIQLTEKVGASAEISGGTSGMGGLAGLEYKPTADDSYSVGYRLDPDRASSLDAANELSGTDGGAIVFGARKKVTELASAYTGSSLDLYGRRRSLTQTYGITYTPDTVWTIDGGVQTGSIHDTTIDPTTAKERSDFTRQGISGSVSYNNEATGFRGHVRTELRHEDSQDDTRDGNTYLLASGFTINSSPNWRLLGGLDLMASQSKSGTYDDGTYLKLTTGAAYRPVDNDRFNGLFKYIYLYDVPGSNQISSATTTGETLQQRSHILSADLSYDLYPWLTVGTKHGLRVGEVRGGDVYPDWQASIAYLATARADLHIVRNWDALVEGRVLYMPSAKTADYGALAAIYRHIGDNFKVGAGYNFGRFSDDLSDLTLDDGGVFTNVVGKF
ncbi:hypothetical protein DFR52_1092 [Hoeflea marina]|uniref:Uncharacterized protein n=1 Tax=Hoeflea marina TaxID=274592 RepID=A0A317PHS9_9HYPH|nr:hypothetical protein [Hoeflea marina]PWV95607.1 hypothetical protein DFR52_1092 [Hoeflea marina]